MDRVHLALVGKYQILVQQDPAGSNRWFYSIGELVAARFKDHEELQHVGPFESMTTAVEAARAAIATDQPNAMIRN